MNAVSSNIPSPLEVLRLLRVHLLLWLAPAVLISAAAGIYALIYEDRWEASQALIVRNEAAVTDRSPGKFNYPEEMKNIQETLLEVARSRSVLAAALREVGPPADCDDQDAWPGDRDIDAVRKHVKLSPPKGAEFGKTEVFYLTVRAESRQRAVKLNEAIFKHLNDHFQQIRDAKAQSMIEELTKTVTLAKADLEQATNELAKVENGLGSDLAELRSMQDLASSDSALRRSAEELRAQLRDNEAAAGANRELLAVLKKARKNPGRLAATPNRLLESHPSLRRLKDGLVDAQLRTAELSGKMADTHPKVKAAKEAEEEIGRQLNAELALACRSIEMELRLIADRGKLLESQLAQTNRRLHNLATLRATYANQVSETKNRATLLERAQQSLAEARAVQASAKAASLITPIGSADPGIRPVGPGRVVIVLCGVVGGLLTGFGLMFLAVPATSQPVEMAKAPEQPAGKNFSIVAPARRINGHLSIGRALHKLVN